MRVIIPQAIDLQSSNVDASELPEWDSTSTYASGDQVKVTLETDGSTPRQPHKIYTSNIDSNTDNYPPDNLDNPDDGSDPPWTDDGATNRWAMFDDLVNSQTTAPLIEVSVDASRADSVALFAINGTSLSISLTNNSTGDVVYSETLDLRLDSSSSWSDYFFGDFEYRTDIALNYPIYYDATLDIAISHESDDAACGHVVIGREQYIGSTQFGLSAGIRDFSKKETSEKGLTTFVRRDWAKRMSLDLLVDTAVVDKIQRTFAKLRGTPAVYQGNNQDSGFESLLVYGFFESFDPVISGPVYSNCSLEITGLI